jgi:hypothetical protein
MIISRAGKAPWESRGALNIHLAGVDLAAFVRLRETRDRTLPMPKLMLQT